MSSMVEFRRPDGKACHGFYAAPAEAARAGIVLIQEWWGLNDQIKGVATRLSGAGYSVLVPDLYRGQASVDAKEAEHLMNQLDFADAATQDIRGAVQHLKHLTSRTGIMGFCMGGALAVLAAANVAEADAIICYYGCPPLDYVNAAEIKAPFLGHFAIHDAFFPITLIDGLEEKFKAARVNYEFYRYDNMHAFANETMIDPPIPAKYDPAAARTSWERTWDFLKRTLG